MFQKMIKRGVRSCDFCSATIHSGETPFARDIEKEDVPSFRKSFPKVGKPDERGRLRLDVCALCHYLAPSAVGEEQ